MSSENDSGNSFYALDMSGLPEQPPPIATSAYSSTTSHSQNVLRPNECIRIPSNQMNHATRNRSYDEIKAELPIKSEVDHLHHLTAGQRFSAKDANVDSQRGISPGQCSVESASSTSSSPFRILTSSANLTRPPESRVKCLKCELCPFMSITQDGIASHMENVHSSQQPNDFGSTSMFRKKIKCPGCDNIFYMKKSLKIHLAKDHQMSSTEIMPLIESLAEAPASSDGRAKKAGARKQKIYLRNVEVLKNPQFASNLVSQETGGMILSQCSQDAMRMGGDASVSHSNSAFGQMEAAMTICRSTVDLPSNASSIDERISISNSTTPSIDDVVSVRPDSGSSVKFVDSISGHNDWQIGTNSNFDSFAQTTASWDYQAPKHNETISCTFPSPIPPIGICQNERKKIYIKNIDILKEPLILTPGASSSSGRKHIHLRTVDEVNLMFSNRVSRS